MLLIVPFSRLFTRLDGGVGRSRLGKLLASVIDSEGVMVIREGDNFVEIVATDRISDNLPTAGDTRLKIKVQSSRFAGEGWAWMDAACLAAFVEQLRKLELERQGYAEIESMSAGQFQLRIWAIDRLGHTALIGQLQQPETQFGYAHTLKFGFQFSPDLLPRIVRDLEAIASGVRNSS